MKKVIGITILIVILLMGLTIPTYALSFKIKLTPSQRTVAPGNEVFVTVSTSNLNIGGSGMNTFMCTLQYDTNVFEIVQDSDISGLNGWSVMYYAANNRILADLNDVTTGGFIQQDADLFRIKFKVKESATSETGVIQIQDPATSNGRMDVTADPEILTLSLKSIDSTTYVIGEDNTISNVLPGTTVTTLINNIEGPQNLVVKDLDGNPITTGQVGTGSKVVTSAGEQYTIIVKGDLNGDGLLDVRDLAQFIYHIIDKTKLQGIYLQAADVNASGLSDIVDLSQMVLAVVDKITL